MHREAWLLPAGQVAGPAAVFDGTLKCVQPVWSVVSSRNMHAQGGATPCASDLRAIASRPYRPYASGVPSKTAAGTVRQRKSNRLLAKLSTFGGFGLACWKRQG